MYYNYNLIKKYKFMLNKCDDLNLVLYKNNFLRVKMNLKNQLVLFTKLTLKNINFQLTKKIFLK